MGSSAEAQGMDGKTGRAPVDGLLPRNRLIDTLLGNRATRMTLFEAPAGYGKTTTLKLWDAADSRPFAWVSCQERHNDPALLIESVIEALNGFSEVDEAVLMSMGSPDPDLNLVLSGLGREIGAMDPFVLVFDDAHLLETDPAWHVIYSVIVALPEQAQATISTRTHPGLPVGRLRARRELLEFGVSDLALTRRESKELLGRLHSGLSDRADEIHEQTEGWPAALYLAGLTVRNGDETAASEVDFNGGDRAVVEYFRDEFFQGMEDGEAQFLYRTSILEELTGPVCDLLTDRHDSASLLEGLSEENALIVRLDRKGSRYRYHHLFAEMLRSELARREPEMEPELHRRAAVWLAANGEIPRATDHAIAAGDFELAGSLIFLDIADITGRGRIATVDRWFEEIGDDQIARVPALILARLHREMAMGQGDASFYWLSVAERVIGKDSPCYGDLLMVRITIGPDGPDGMIKDATLGAELLDPSNPFQVPAKLYRGIGLFLKEESEAENVIRQAAREAALISPLIQSLALAHLALAELERDRIDEAYAHITRARDQVERCGLSGLATMSIVYGVLASVLSRQGQLEEAAAALEHSRRMCEGMEDFITWFEAELLLSWCRTLIRLGQFETAATLLTRAEEVASRTPRAPRLDRWIAQAKEWLARPTGGSHNLTKAELRTLQFLPSHHSFRAIGEQLCLSQNTVKTQANSLYRKLGVNSRAEAVMEGRRLGLLSGDTD